MKNPNEEQTLSLLDLRRISNALRKQRRMIFKVETQQQADRMTREDPAGHIWKVGEKYCLASIKTEERS